MIAHGLTFLFTVLMWWLGTAIILILCTRPRRTFARSLFGSSVVLLASLYGLFDSARTASAIGPYVSFLSAVGIWGWLEMSFLMGYVTGPRTTPCPPGATGWRRFRLAFETLLFHELAIAATAVLIVGLTWQAPNQTGTLAFLILMVMRISAKLNIFLGVPNLSDEFLPEHLGYLKSYFCKRRFNLLFPVSILGSLVAAVWLARLAFGTEGPEAVGAALLLTLLSLAIVEHFFMMLPVADGALWLWAVPTDTAKSMEKRLP
jgi:putative photosynthetic complex assembly protein 2